VQGHINKLQILEVIRAQIAELENIRSLAEAGPTEGNQHQPINVWKAISLSTNKTHLSPPLLHGAVRDIVDVEIDAGHRAPQTRPPLGQQGRLHVLLGQD
jgi:hypothetical protein